MYKTSTYFIKGQIPNTSVNDLLELYKQELEDQSVSNILIENSCLIFSNDTFRFVGNRYANKFSGFTSGRIIIEDDGSEYLVTLEAENSRTFTMAAIIAGTVTLMSLFSSDFNFFSFLIGIIIFIAISGIGYGTSSISFPIYFESLRNDIEQKLQTEYKAEKDRNF